MWLASQYYYRHHSAVVNISEQNLCLVNYTKQFLLNFLNIFYWQTAESLAVAHGNL